jgi:c(7)-type cytochrome triheme protein
MRRFGFAALALAAIALPAFIHAEQASGKKRRPLPPEFGRVVLDKGSAKGGQAPVVFDHWLHRSRYTCRLCHVDIGFAMTANGTGIKASDNAAGFYCGACHNGRMVVGGKKLFESCNRGAPGEQKATCVRCHSLGKNVKPEVDFVVFTRGFPKGRFGNGIDWEKAEEAGLIKPIDFLEGVSVPRKSLAAQKDFALSPKLEGMPEIIFSHSKHTVWNGCELCHPEIFGAVKKGTVKYTMSEIFDGKYCGVCHVTVAFPMQDCQRCHTKAVK